MLGASGFFTFKHLISQDAGPKWIYAFAYKPPGKLQSGVLDQLIVESCYGPLIPDVLVIVGLKDDTRNELTRQLKSRELRMSRTRIEGRIALVLALYNLSTGRVDIELLDEAFETHLEKFRKNIKDSTSSWLHSGLTNVFLPEDVILRAPPGYAYQKPSGSRSEIFLKPDLGLKSSANVGFVALALYHHTYAGRTDSFASLQTVYVDTMAVSPVAYALQDLLILAGFKNSFHIESFHSYGGMTAVPRPLPATTLCVISASTSMSMHKQWMHEKGVGPSEVVTLITLVGADSQEYALLGLKLPTNRASPGPAQLSIRIKGETFLPEQEPAKKVLLRDLIHRCDEEVRHFSDFAGTGVFDTYRKPGRSGSTARALFVDGEVLIHQLKFEQWLKRSLMLSVKAATKVVIFQDDNASRLLAENVLSYCQQTLSLKEVRLVVASSLHSEQLDVNDGVIVCAAVVGKGSQLLEISRELRDKHNGPRLFVVGFQVTEGRNELLSLRSNLIHAKGALHDFQRYGCAAIGTQLKQSFEDEVRRFYASSSDTATLPGSMAPRSLALSSVAAVGPLALLPHGRSADEALRIRPGFAYWPDGFTAEAYQPEILGTVGVLLQRAREHDKLLDEHRLWSGTYRHVVLDPENFARFNDGILQAALLRCAYPSELDYRADKSASDFMKAVILRAISRANDQAGEAILEFLLALTQRRLQLVDDHHALVMKAAAEYEEVGPLQQAIRFLTAPNLPNKLPF